MYECKLCDKKFNNYESLRKHSGRTHKIPSEQFYVEFYLNGIHPVCKCGCGETTKFTGHGFKEYKQGHISRIKNNWGHNQKAIDNSAQTRRTQYKNGERKVWNDGLTKETSNVVKLIGEKCKKENNPNRAEKISKTQKLQFKKGIRNNSGKNNPMYGKNHNEKSKEIMKMKRVEYMNKFLIKNETKLEKKFKKILNDLNIEYEFQSKLGNFNYDFLLKNKLIVEIDGDFWHCNPNKWEKPIYESQKHTIKHDKIKTKWAKDNGYKLLRFWESDINENPAKIVKKLLNTINI